MTSLKPSDARTVDPAAVEVLGPDQAVQVFASVLPFQPALSTQPFSVPAGTTCAEIVARAQPHALLRGRSQVYIGQIAFSHLVRQRHWRRVRPKPGTVVYLRQLPGDTDFQRIFLGLALVALAVGVPWLAGLEAPLAGLVAGAIGLAGTFAINQLIPPPDQASPKVGSLKTPATITGTSNVLDPNGVIEMPLGETRVWPKLLAEPFREVVDNKTFVRMAFAARGPIEIDEPRFGTTSVDKLQKVKIRYTNGWPASPQTFAAADVIVAQNRIKLPGHVYASGQSVRFKGDPPAPLNTKDRYYLVNVADGGHLEGAGGNGSVKVAAEEGDKPIKFTSAGTGGTIYRWEKPPGVFPDQLPFSEAYNVRLKEGKEVIRETAEDVDEANVIFYMPLGLGKQDQATGDLDAQTILVRVRYRKASGGPWSTTDETAFPGRNSPRIPTPPPKRVGGRDPHVLQQAAAYLIALNPDTGRITQPSSLVKTLPRDFSGKVGGPTDPNWPGVPPVPDHLVPIAVVVRRSDDNNKVGKKEIFDIRPSVAGQGWPLGVRFRRRDDFAPRPTSPRGPRIRIRGGSISKVALAVRLKKLTAFRRLVNFEFPERDKYEIEVKRINEEGDTAKGEFDRVFLEEITSFRNEPLLAEEAREQGVALIELRAKATDNLEGRLDRFNFIARTLWRDWNGTRWRWRATKNPASIGLRVLMGPGNPTPPAPELLIREDWQAFHDFCTTQGYSYGRNIDFPSRTLDVLRGVLSLSRARLDRPDGRVGLAIDEEKTVTNDLFSAENIIRDSINVAINWKAAPQGYRIKFQNENKGGRDDERLVFRAGFDENNVDWSKVLTLQADGIIDPKHARHFAQYWLGVWEGRRRIFTWEVGLHAFRVRAGMLVGLNHGLAFKGKGHARVVALGVNLGAVETVTLSRPVTMAAGNLYGAQVAKGDGSLLALDVDLALGAQTVLTLSNPPVAGSAFAPELDNMLAFGIRGNEAAPVLIQSVVPTAAYRARITAVDLAPEIFAKDATAAHDAVDPADILTSIEHPVAPRPPVLVGTFSDERVTIAQDGSFQAAIVDALQPRPEVQAETVQWLDAQIRLAPEPELPGEPTADEDDPPWEPLAPLSADVYFVRFTEVEVGQTYQRRFRYRGAFGPSDWFQAPDHRVVGISVPPPSVTDMRLVQSEIAGTLRRKLVWVEPNPQSKYFQDYLLRHRQGTVRQWAGMEELAAGAIKGNEADVSTLPRGLRTYAIRGRDVAGNLSPDPEFLTVDLGAAPVANVVVAVDEKARGWPGTVTGGSIVSDAIVAQDDDVAFLPNDEAPFLPNDGTGGTTAAAFLPITYGELIYETVLLPSSVDAPVRCFIDVDHQGEGLVISFKEDSQEAFLPDDGLAFLGGPAADGSPWLPGPPDFVPWQEGTVLTHQAYTFRFTIPAGNLENRIDGLTFTLDVPDVEEQLTGVAIPAGGARLVLTKSYRRIKGVSFTLFDDGGTGVTAKRQDLDATLGPSVTVRDKDGLSVAGTIDALVQGY